MAGHTLGTIRGTIQIDYDGAGVVKAIKDTDNLSATGNKLNNTSNSVLSAFGKFGKGALTFGAAVSTVNSTVGLLVGTLSILGPVAAAGLAAAPALMVGYAAATTVAKIATAGFGEALKAAGGDSKKFEESIKNLSPQAQATAKAFRASLPVLQGVQKAMQDAFFKGTAGQVKGVVTQVARLRPEGTAVAATMGQVAQEIIKTAASGKNINNIKEVLRGVNAFLLQVKGSIGPVITGFLGLAAQGAAFGATLGGSVANGLANLSRWLSSIDVKAVFAEAMPIIKSLGAFLGDVAVIAKELFGIFIGDGQGAAGVLAQLASNLAAFLQSAEGQAALDALGTAMTTIGGAAGQVFLALLQALAPAIVALAPGAGELATQIAGVLVPAIAALSPLLSGLAGFLSENMSWLGPVAGAVGAVALAYKAYSAAAAATTAVQGALNSALAVNTAAWVRNTAATVAARAAQAGMAVVVGAQAVAAWVASTAAIVANRVALMASAAVAGGAAVAGWVANTAAIVANRVATVASTVAMAVVRGAVMAWTAVQWALNAALTANPIGLVVAAIALLVAGIIYAWRNSETFRTVVLAVWAAIKTAIAAVVNWITGTVWPSLQRAWQQIQDGARSLWSAITSIWNGIRNTISTVLNAIRAVVSAVWSAVVAVVQSHIATVRSVVLAGFNAVRNTVNTVMNAVRNVVRTIWAAIVAVVRSQINAVKSAINTVSSIVGTLRGHFNRGVQVVKEALSNAVSAVRQFPGRVVSALGNVGSLLYSKGKALIQGFVDGIKAMAGAAANAARNVVSSVTDFLPGSPAKKGPLSGRGYVFLRAKRFMDDFASGIDSGSAKPQAAVLRSASGLASGTTPRFVSRGNGTAMERAVAGAARSIVNRRGPAPQEVDVSDGGTRTYHIKIGEKEFATLVVDAVTGNPVAVAKAANEGNRRTAWSGSGRAASPRLAILPRRAR